MIKRTNRKHILELLKENSEWNVLDLGGGRDPFTLAQTVADIEDYSELYENKHKEKRFVQSVADETPFEDKEFDFVIATHIAEHVPNPEKFIKELTRIGKRGFIEVPTPFFDNLTAGNSDPLPHGHLWWVTFDDVKNEIVFKPKVTILKEVIGPRDTTFLSPCFIGSMVTMLYWEDSIEFSQEEAIFEYEQGNSSPTRKIDLRNKSGFKEFVVEIKLEDALSLINDACSEAFEAQGHDAYHAIEEAEKIVSAFQETFPGWMAAVAARNNKDK